MKPWQRNGAGAILGAGSALGGLLLSACRGSCGSCYGCVGGGIFTVVLLVGSRFGRSPKKRDRATVEGVAAGSEGFSAGAP